MLQDGKVYKVKVELSSGEVGFGRATIVGMESGKYFVQLRTSREANLVLPKGARLWFYSDSPLDPGAGLWATSVVGARIVHGRTVMECHAPKFEPIQQKRRSMRVPLDAPVTVELPEGRKRNFEVRTYNISRSGVGLDVDPSGGDVFDVGSRINIGIDSKLGEISLGCRVIRKQLNWLANKIEVGLEFVEIAPDAASLLDRLLLSLGAKSREGSEEAGKAAGLAAWMKTSRTDLKLVRPEPQSGGGDKEQT